MNNTIRKRRAKDRVHINSPKVDSDASVSRTMNIMKTEMSISDPSREIQDESEIKARQRKKKIFLWAILWAVFPPVLLFVLLAAIMKPAIKGKEPSGINYLFWILGLIIVSAMFQLPFGHFDTIAAALRKPSVCNAILFADGIAAIFSLILIALTFRNTNPNPYVPMKRFKVDGQTILLCLLSFSPLLIMLLSNSPFRNPDDTAHPLLAALAGSLNSGSYFAVVVGLLSIGLFGPVLEEIIFRGMLLEGSHEEARSKGMKYLLDFIVCLFFALLHLPVSFFIPFALAVAFIYVRRRSGSLWPSIIMHASWNSSILIAMISARQNI